MVADYSKQLTDIANALNRPTTPTWLVAGLSVLSGSLLSLAAQWYLLRANDSYKRHKMRRILYAELSSLYESSRSNFNHILKISRQPNVPGGFDEAALLRNLKSSLHFRGQEYAVSNIETYLQLEERNSLESLYIFFKQSITQESSTAWFSWVAISATYDAVHRGFLKDNYVKSFFPKRYKEFKGMTTFIGDNAPLGQEDVND